MSAGRIYPDLNEHKGTYADIPKPDAENCSKPGSDKTTEGGAGAGAGAGAGGAGGESQLAPYANPKPVPANSKFGETKEQMECAEKILAENLDTSIDAEWEVHSFGIVDVYTVVVMVVFFLPKLLIFYPMLWIFLFPPVFCNWIYVKMLPQPLVSISRSSCTWTLHVVLQYAMSIPAQLLVLVNYCIDNFLWLAAGVFWCTITCGWGRWWRNIKVLRPFTGGPSLYLHFPDCVAAAAGMIFRQGLFEFMRSFPMMFILNPWVKYWVIANPFLFDFSDKLRFITQIGQKMNDMPLEGIDENFRKCISNCKHLEKNREILDSKFFCPHYPFPPPGRQWAVGMQYASRITTFVHTTHLRGEVGNAFVLSTSCHVPEYRVMLWHNNPFHIYTGYVEASITHGRPSQQHKQYGGEHPMWLVNGRNYLGAHRKVNFSIGWIDVFFDEFIPHFQHFIRGNVRGWEEADEHLKADPGRGYEGELMEAGQAGGPARASENAGQS